MEEITTPTVKLLADGGIECAKGLELKDCGYKPGAKVCGKCGAKAVTQTEEAVPADMAPGVASEKSAWVTADNEKGVRKNMHASPMMEEELPDASVPKKKKPMMDEEEILTPEKAAMLEEQDEAMMQDDVTNEDEEKMYLFKEID